MTTAKHVATVILTRLAAIDVHTDSRKATGADTPPTKGSSSGHGETSQRFTLATLPPDARSQVQPLLLALHFLFPHEFLPALDILDRRLIRCLRLQDTFVDVNTMPPDREVGILSGPGVFYVQSASSQHEHDHHMRGAAATTLTLTKQWYEVRLDSWNCSCAAFAQSSLRELLIEEAGNEQVENEHRPGVLKDLGIEVPSNPGVSGGWAGTFGGHDIYSSDTVAVPICKHILAAAIGSAVPNLFGSGVDMKAVSLDVLAGMAAGWGDG